MPVFTPLEVSSGRGKRGPAPPRRVRIKHEERARGYDVEAVARKFEGVRPEVMRFAIAMEETLRRHDPEKGGSKEWRKLPIRDAYRGLFQEVQELELEVDGRVPRRILAEAVDVGCTALIVHDLARRKVSRS